MKAHGVGKGGHADAGTADHGEERDSGKPFHLPERGSKRPRGLREVPADTSRERGAELAYYLASMAFRAG